MSVAPYCWGWPQTSGYGACWEKIGQPSVVSTYRCGAIIEAKLKEARAAAAAASAAMHREVLADVEPPATTDPKIAILNLIQA